MSAPCAPRVEHRSSGWQRWRGVCAGHEDHSPWGGKADADEWVLDHLQDHPLPLACRCLVLLGADLVETSPLDCPLHKETASND